MQKTYRKSKKLIHERDSTQSDATVNRTDIFKLVSLIPKTSRTSLPFTNYKSNLKYAAGLLAFCEAKFPEKIQGLFFNRNQGIDSLIFELSNLIISEGIKITYESECFEASGCIDFVCQQEDYSWYWYVMEGKHYHQIKSRELRTAFFKLLNKFSRSTEVTFLDHNFENGQDSHFDEIEDYLEMNYQEDFEGEVVTETYDEYFKRLTEPIKDCLIEYNNHINLDLDNAILKSYKPKNKFEKQLKKLLIEGLEEIDFSIIHKFADHINPYPNDDDGEEAFMFSLSFMVLYDSESTFEEELLQGYNHRLDNIEVTYPASYYRYQNKKLTKGTTQDDSNTLKRTCQFLASIENLFVP